MTQLLTCQLSPMFLYKEMTFRISKHGGTRLYYLPVKYLKKMPWTVCTKLRYESLLSIRLYLAMHNQEIDRDRPMPSCQRLKMLVRRHIDRMIRTRNFRAWIERIETGVLLKSHKGKNLSVERRMGKCYQWKVNGAQTQIDGRKPSKGMGPTRENPTGRKRQKPCKHYFKGTCTNPSCNCWDPPTCQNYIFKLGSKCGESCPFRHTDVDRRPNKKLKRSGGKGSVALLMKSFQLGCVSQDTESPKTSVPRKSGSNRAVTCSTWHHTNSGKKGSIARGYAKGANLQNAIRVLLHLRKEQWMKPCNKNDAPAEKHGTWRKHIHQLKSKDRATFYFATEAWVMLAPSSKKSRGGRNSGRFWSINAHAEQKKGLSLGELEPLRKSRNPTTAVTANGEVQTSQDAQVYVHGLELFVTVHILEHTPAVLSSGKLCEEHGYTCELASVKCHS